MSHEDRKNKLKRVVEFGSRPSISGQQLSLRLTKERTNALGTPIIFKKPSFDVLSDGMKHTAHKAINEWFLSNPTDEDREGFEVADRHWSKSRTTPLAIALNNPNWVKNITAVLNPLVSEDVESGDASDFYDSADLSSLPQDHLDALRVHFQQVLLDSKRQIRIIKSNLDNDLNISPLFKNYPELLYKEKRRADERTEWLVTKLDGKGSITPDDFKDPQKAKEYLATVLLNSTVREKLDKLLSGDTVKSKELMAALFGDRILNEPEALQKSLVGLKYQVDSVKHNLDNVYRSRVALNAIDKSLIEQKHPDYYKQLKKRIDFEIEKFLEEEELLTDLMSMGLGIMADFGITNDISVDIKSTKSDLQESQLLKQQAEEHLLYNIAKWKQKIIDPEEAASAGFTELLEKSMKEYRFWATSEAFRKKELERLQFIEQRVQSPSSQSFGYVMPEQFSSVLENADMMLLSLSLQQETLLDSRLEMITHDTAKQWAKSFIDEGSIGWEKFADGGISEFKGLTSDGKTMADLYSLMSDDNIAFMNAQSDKYKGYRANTLIEYQKDILPNLLELWVEHDKLKVFDLDKKPGLFQRIKNAFTGKMDHEAFINDQYKRADDMVRLATSSDVLAAPITSNRYNNLTFDNFLDEVVQVFEEKLPKELLSVEEQRSARLKLIRKSDEEKRAKESQLRIIKSETHKMETDLSKAIKDLEFVASRRTPTKEIKPFMIEKARDALDREVSRDNYHTIMSKDHLDIVDAIIETSHPEYFKAIPSSIPNRPYKILSQPEATYLNIDYDRAQGRIVKDVVRKPGWVGSPGNMRFNPKSLSMNITRLPAEGRLGKDLLQYVHFKPDNSVVKPPSFKWKREGRNDYSTLGFDLAQPMDRQNEEFFDWFAENWGTLADYKKRSGSDKRLKVPARILFKSGLNPYNPATMSAEFVDPIIVPGDNFSKRLSRDIDAQYPEKDSDLGKINDSKRIKQLIQHAMKGVSAPISEEIETFELTQQQTGAREYESEEPVVTTPLLETETDPIKDLEDIAFQIESGD